MSQVLSVKGVDSDSLKLWVNSLTVAVIVRQLRLTCHTLCAVQDKLVSVQGVAP
jgi:hypothetical protein